ncbi:MAG TPA: hypothetical protein VHT30_07070 [Acidimicrobiales bacterium]|nr:hypothetical protein [Acidimicrobiales bacterium]
MVTVVADVAREHIVFWWVTLGLGAVVISAVILLLALLVTFVDDIDKNVREVWDTATRVAQNTATTWMLNQAGSLTADLRNEVRKHAELFEAAAAAERGR